VTPNSPELVLTKKPTSLDVAMARKATAAADTATPPARAATRTVPVPVRLPALAHDQLREQAFTGRPSQHSIVLEGLTLVFERNCKPPVAT